MWLRLFQRNVTQVIPKARHLHSHVYCISIHNNQAMEIAKMPHYWWMD
jgi:hypothetical protein